jgi:type I restriction enzyme M protein
MSDTKLDITTLENWLWEAACKIWGDVDAPKYKDYILPLIFLKRLSDVFEDEVLDISADYSGRDVWRKQEQKQYIQEMVNTDIWGLNI